MSENSHPKRVFGQIVAEKKGFEPLIPLWGIHDFQSCALDQLRDFSTFAQVKSRIFTCQLGYYNAGTPQSQGIFSFFEEKFSGAYFPTACAKYR